MFVTKKKYNAINDELEALRLKYTSLLDKSTKDARAFTEAVSEHKKVRGELALQNTALMALIGSCYLKIGDEYVSLDKTLQTTLDGCRKAVK